MRRAIRQAALGLAVAMSLGGLIEPVLGQTLTANSANAPRAEKTVPLSPAQSRWLECSIELAFLADKTTFPFPLKARYIDGRLEVGGKVNSEAARLRAVQLAGEFPTVSVIDRVHLEDIKRPTPFAMTPAQLTEAAAKLLVSHLAEHIIGLEVATHDGMVIIVHGQAASLEDKLSVSQYLRDLPGCQAVQNKLTLTRVSLHGMVLNRVTRDGQLTVAAEGTAEVEQPAANGKIVQVGAVTVSAAPEPTKEAPNPKPSPSPTKTPTQPSPTKTPTQPSPTKTPTQPSPTRTPTPLIAMKADANKTATAKAAPKPKPMPGMMQKTTWTVLGEEPKETPDATSPRVIAKDPVVPSTKSIAEVKSPGVEPKPIKPATTPVVGIARETANPSNNTVPTNPEPKKPTLQLTRFDEGKSTPPAKTVEQLPLKEPTVANGNPIPANMDPLPAVATPAVVEAQPKAACCCTRQGGFWNQLFPFGISCQAIPVDTSPGRNTSSYGMAPQVAAPAVAKTNPIVPVQAKEPENSLITAKINDKMAIVTKNKISAISTKPTDKVVLIAATVPAPTVHPASLKVTEGRIIMEADPVVPVRESSLVSEGRIIFEPEKIVTPRASLQVSRRELKQTIQRLVSGYAHDIDVIGSQDHGMIIKMTVLTKENEVVVREKMMQLPELSSSDVRLEIKMAEY